MMIFNEIINRQDSFDIEIVDWDRYEWNVGGKSYFMCFSPISDYNGYKSYLITFGLKNHGNPYREVSTFNLDVVLKIVRTLGVCVTTFAYKNKVRYLFFKSNMSHEERNNGVEDPVRSRLFVRWYKQNYPDNSIFKNYKFVGVDYLFLFDENDILREGKSFHETWSKKCFRLNPYLKNMLIPISYDIQFKIIESEVKPGKYIHEVYYGGSRYLLESGLEGFWLEKHGSPHIFETGEEFKEILLKYSDYCVI
jgi:hypothetical protein